MITKPQGYDEAPAYTGEFATLPAGLYVCEILGVKQEEYNGHSRFVMQFDIASTISYILALEQPQVWIGRPMVSAFE